VTFGVSGGKMAASALEKSPLRGLTNHQKGNTIKSKTICDGGAIECESPQYKQATGLTKLARPAEYGGSPVFLVVLTPSNDSSQSENQIKIRWRKRIWQIQSF
jgi:hypothetical protein